MGSFTLRNINFILEDSKHTFTIDNHRWYSVYQYLVVTLCFDRKYRDILNRIKETFELQLFLIKNREKIVTFSEQEYIKSLSTSVTAKFTQNPTLLRRLQLLDEDIQFVFENKYMREILLKLTKSHQELKRDLSEGIVDIPGYFDRKYIKKYTRIVSNLLTKIHKLEGVPLHYEMVEDSLLILYPEYRRLVRRSQEWAKSNNTLTLAIQLPNFSLLVSYVKSLNLSENTKSLHIYISAFLLFYFNKYRELNLHLTDTKNFKLKDIRLPKRQRSYRCNIPDELFSEIKNQDTEVSQSTSYFQEHILVESEIKEEPKKLEVQIVEGKLKEEQPKELKREFKDKSMREDELDIVETEED